MMQKRFTAKILLPLFLVSIIGGQNIGSDSTKVSRKIIVYDKIQHTAVSCLLTLSGQYVLENKANIGKTDATYYSASSTALIGLTKELNDKHIRSKPFDWGDMIANIAGIGLAVLIINL